MKRVQKGHISLKWYESQLRPVFPKYTNWTALEINIKIAEP
jgi:hypothetical protein